MDTGRVTPKTAPKTAYSYMSADAYSPIPCYTKPGIEGTSISSDADRYNDGIISQRVQLQVLNRVQLRGAFSMGMIQHIIS